MNLRQTPASARALPPGIEPRPWLRGLLLVLGGAAFALGIVGLFLPLVPSVPFFIGAAACFARAHRPLHDWMLDHRWLGPMLREWYQHRSMPRRTKFVVIGLTSVSFGISIVLFVRPAWLKLVMGAFGLALVLLIARIPSRR